MNDSHQHFSPTTICPIKKTTYHCGYVQKTLVFPCYFGATLYRVADDHAPIFCLHDLKVNKSITIGEPYGTSPAYIYDRLQLKVLKPLLHRQVVLQDEFAEYAARIRRIEACLERSNRPRYNFRQIEKEGWDVNETQEQQDKVWNHDLPGSVKRATDSFASASDELTIAYSLTLNHLLKSHDGISRSSSHLPPLKTLSSSGSPLTDIDMGVYKQILQLTIKALQDELYLLEVNAVNACMDDVGWVLPNEENARSRLEPIMTLRLVQPERKSGTSRREAFIRGAR